MAASCIPPSIPDLRQLLGFEEGTLRGIDFDVWEDDGSEAFATVLQRVSQEGYLFETVALS